MTSQTIEAPLTEHTSREELDRLVNLQRTAFLKEGTPSADVRRNRIDRLILAVLEHADEFSESIGADFGRRSGAMTKIVEVLGMVEESQYMGSKLDEWMQPIDVQGPIPAKVMQSPLGVVGIIPAWNGPVVLAVQPAVAALAAGNRVIIKTNDLQPRTAAVLQKAISEQFPEDEVAVVVGDEGTTREFSKLPLDHLMFTGSPAVGRIVAQNAAKNLVPVTLELGGKNPVVVSRSADLGDAARKVATTRLFNNGQVCACPDYAFVPREKLDEFVKGVTDHYLELLPTLIDNPGATSIVNESNFDRVVGLIADAVEKGATRIEAVNPAEADLLPSREHRLIAPTILLDVPEEAAIASNEIFGPVLPVYAYDDISEAVNYINTRPSPLAAYYYGGDDEEFEGFLSHTRSGGVTRNDGGLHFFVANAPFGGVGNSGTGAYHGKYGFDEFTHQRTVAIQTQDSSAAAGLTGVNLTDPNLIASAEQGVAQATSMLRERLGR